MLYSRKLDTDDDAVVLGKTGNDRIRSVCLTKDGQKIYVTGGEWKDSD